MRVRITKRLAHVIDGVDLSDYEVGDLIELPDREAALLMAEGWAVADARGAGPGHVLAFRRTTDPGHISDEDAERRAS